MERKKRGRKFSIGRNIGRKNDFMVDVSKKCFGKNVDWNFECHNMFSYFHQKI